MKVLLVNYHGKEVKKFFPSLSISRDNIVEVSSLGELIKICPGQRVLVEMPNRQLSGLEDYEFVLFFSEYGSLG
jgi:hypothetical protein